MSKKIQRKARKTVTHQVSRITYATEEIINDENWLLGFTKDETKIPNETEIPIETEIPNEIEIPNDTENQQENAPENPQLGSNSENKIIGWSPITALGSMVKHKYYQSIKEIRQNNLTISEPSIIDYLLGPTLSSEILYVKPMFNEINDIRGYLSCACAGDKNGHFGYSIKFDDSYDNAVQESLDRAINLINPIKRLPYTIKEQTLYTVPFPVTGSSAGVMVTLSPECSRTAILNPEIFISCMLSLAGIDNCAVEIEGYHSFVGHLGLATYEALSKLWDLE